MQGSDFLVSLIMSDLPMNLEEINADKDLDIEPLVYHNDVEEEYTGMVKGINNIYNQSVNP